MSRPDRSIRRPARPRRTAGQVVRATTLLALLAGVACGAEAVRARLAPRSGVAAMVAVVALDMLATPAGESSGAGLEPGTVARPAAFGPVAPRRRAQLDELGWRHLSLPPPAVGPRLRA